MRGPIRTCWGLITQRVFKNLVFTLKLKKSKSKKNKNLKINFKNFNSRLASAGSLA